MKRFLLFALIAMVPNSLLAQKGKITGNVLDTDFGDVLIGASIKVEGTNMGTITDFDGNYSISLAPGTYSITCSYISYATQTVKEIKVKAGEAVKVNFAMSPAALGLEEVEVVARKREDNEVSLIAMQRKAPIVLDGISSDLISKTGDSDAAGALKRVTGISVEGGKYVYVRGLSDRYSKTLLNGADLPSLDPERNAVQMDMFPTNIIENIVVKKTFSPELPGNFTGGLVDIKTKDFPSQFNLKVSAKLDYNPQANLRDDFLSYEGGSTDWLAMDDGTRDIPALARGEVPDRYENDPRLDKITKSFNKIMAPSQKQSFLNQSYSFGVGNATTLFGKEFGYNIGTSYKRKFKYFDDGKIQYYYLPDPTASQMTEQRSSDIYRKGEEDVIWAILMNGNLKLNQNNKIGLTLMRNQSSNKEASYSFGPKPSDEASLKTEVRELIWVQRSLNTAQLSGEHYMPFLLNTKVNWLGSYTQSRQDEPDYRYFGNSYYAEDSSYYSIDPQLYATPTRYYREMFENNYNFKLDFETPFSLMEQKGKLKYGAAYIDKTREFRERKYNYNENYSSYNGDVDEYLRDENMGMTDPDENRITGIFVENDYNNDQKNSYNGYETVSSFYGMSDYALLHDFRLLTGARVERTYNETERVQYTDNGTNDDDRAEIDRWYVLPALNLTWSQNDTMNIRGAYSRTVARPTFRELAPFATEDFHRGTKVVGNPDLDLTLIDNLDLRWEYYFTMMDMASVSGFYKIFHSPIEQTFNTEAANPELTWRNVDQANLAGVEFELRKGLEFIHFLVRHFRLGANLTLVHSEVAVDEEELETKRQIIDGYPDKRVMYGQAPIIVNMLFGYQNDDIGLQANLVYNYNGRRLAVVVPTGPDIYTEPRGVFNANISKNIGENWKVKFDVNNILNTLYQKTFDFPNRTYIYNQYTVGRTFKFGISYTI